MDKLPARRNDRRRACCFRVNADVYTAELETAGDALPETQIEVQLRGGKDVMGRLITIGGLLSCSRHAGTTPEHHCRL